MNSKLNRLLFTFGLLLIVPSFAEAQPFVRITAAARLANAQQLTPAEKNKADSTAHQAEQPKEQAAAADADDADDKEAADSSDESEGPAVGKLSGSVPNTGFLARTAGNGAEE